MAWGGLFLAQVILAQVILAQVISGRVIHRIRLASPPLVISFPANNALQQKHHAACPSTRLGAKYRPAIIK
ncbi:hypothetical protein OAN95_04865 [Alphaproteobacteria bacterium]|nr:hypothetical protein [Alphaproteobacteria bacterium]